MTRPILIALLTTSLHASDSLFVEAEAFTDRGGWAVDSQFILNMGSAYLMAHGLGTPVDNATTEVIFPSAGTYHLHVRTKDWVAKWEAPGAPGKFKVSVDGKPATTTFGTEGADWHWQSGGTVEIASPKAKLQLHDLTGFNGRCDALYFTKDATDVPPNDSQALFEFRRKALNLPATPPIKDGYDLVVVGGGYSGLGAAISAARHGLKVALIHDRGVLGGNGSSEVQVWAMGGTQLGKFPHLGEIVNEFSDFSRDSPGLIREFVDDLKEEVVRSEERIDLYLNHFAFRTNAKNNRIESVDAVDTTTGAFTRIAGSLLRLDRPRNHQPPFSPIRSGPKAASKPFRQKQFPSSQSVTTPKFVTNPKRRRLDVSRAPTSTYKDQHANHLHSRSSRLRCTGL